MKENLREYTLKLLQAELQTDAKLQCDLIHDIFSSISGISAYTPQKPYQINTQLSSGYALSPFLAARCLPFEIRRTQKFLQGVHRAILKLLRTHETIEILYAGCGPYATLITPLLTLFEPHQLNTTLLDIHQVSLDAVKKIHDTLGLNEYNIQYIKADATKYKCEVKPHLIICEAMFAALKSEPQVAITLNLMPQLAKGGLFVPDNISVEVYGVDCEKEPFNELIKHRGGLRNESYPYGRVFFGVIFNMKTDIECIKEDRFDCKIIETFYKEDTRAFKRLKLALITKVKIIEIDDFSVCLGNYESELTTPVLIDNVYGLVKFWYEMGERPGFKWEVVE